MKKAAKLEKNNKKNAPFVLEHPVALDILRQLRDTHTASGEFKRLVPLAASLLFYEAMKEEKTKKVPLETPYAKTTGHILSDNFIFVGILRSGLALLDGVTGIYPNAPVGHIGIYRDKEMDCTVEYYFRMPSPLENRTIILTDFALASGDTAYAAISRLNDYKVGKIKLLTLISTTKACKRILDSFANVEIYTMAMEQLGEGNRCIPGMGDAGERIYGTI